MEVPKARVERRICKSFLGGPRHAHTKIFESRVSEMPFPGLWGEILQNSDGQKILMVRKQHCNISEASLADVFARQPEPGGPIGVGGPRVCPV